MPQYLITAYDFTDEKALERRMTARPSHLDKAKAMKAAGEIIIGGAIINDEGQMIGSSVIIEMENRAAIDKWLAEEPYVTGKVWDKIMIQEFKVAAL